MDRFEKLMGFLLSNAGIMIGAVSGGFALFRENWKSRFWRALPAVGLVGGMLWALAGAQYDANQHRTEMEGTLKTVQSYVDGQTTAINSHIDAVVRQLEAQGVKPSVAQTASIDQIQNILTAQNTAQSMVNAPQPNRNSLKIWVFNHFTNDVNFSVVKPRLEQLAADVEVRGPITDVPTNSVWWGPGATLNDARTAALIATSAGVQIRQVCSAQHVQQSGLIQIGGAAAAQRLPVLTSAELEALSQPVCD